MKVLECYRPRHNTCMATQEKLPCRFFHSEQLAKYSSCSFTHELKIDNKRVHYVPPQCVAREGQQNTFRCITTFFVPHDSH